MTRKRFIRTTGTVFAILLVLVLGVYGYASLVANPRVAEEIRSDPDSETARRVMLLKLPSGREIPVNYLRRDNLVFAGADGRWWRELSGPEPRPVEITLRGEVLRGSARAVRDDPEYRKAIFAELRPTAPLIFGVLVVVTLDE